MKLTLLANGPLPDLILQEDVFDLCDFLEATCRTIPRGKWAEESIAIAAARGNEGMF